MTTTLLTALALALPAQAGITAVDTASVKHFTDPNQLPSTVPTTVPGAQAGPSVSAPSGWNWSHWGSGSSSRTAPTVAPTSFNPGQNAPISAYDGDLTDDSFALVFEERACVPPGADGSLEVRVDAVADIVDIGWHYSVEGAFTYDHYIDEPSPQAPTVWPAAGTLPDYSDFGHPDHLIWGGFQWNVMGGQTCAAVSSHLVHFDPVTSRQGEVNRITGWVEFDQPIVAVISHHDNLFQSDAVFGHPDVVYSRDYDGDGSPDAVPWRGMEPGYRPPAGSDNPSSFEEYFRITDAQSGPDPINRRLEFAFQAGNPGDQLRVLTRGCCPCPSGG